MSQKNTNLNNIPPPTIFVSEEYRDIIDLDGLIDKPIEQPAPVQEYIEEIDNNYPVIIKIAKGFIVGAPEMYQEHDNFGRISFKTHLSEATMLRVRDVADIKFGEIHFPTAVIYQVRIKSIQTKICTVVLSFRL